MRFMQFCFICLGCLLSAWCRAQENPPAPLPTLSESEIVYFQMLVEGNNRFAFDLYQHLKREPGNLYFSSYSISSI